MSTTLLTPVEPLDPVRFDQEASRLAQHLLGKILVHRPGRTWLMARIIETEAYYLDDKASHASLGFTHKRRALFMDPGTIYMYYARGGDSLNFSARGPGNAVLIKSAFPVTMPSGSDRMIHLMRKNNPNPDGSPRRVEKLCAGQTLLCRSLGLKVKEWDGLQLSKGRFELWEDRYAPTQLIQTTRLGIRCHRDSDLPYRFIDRDFAAFSTKNPLRVRNFQLGRDYTILTP